MRTAHKYLVVGASAAMAIGVAGVASATSGSAPEQTKPYVRYIDAGNTAGPITIGERTWESQVGFVGGTAHNVRPAPGLARSVGRTVLVSPSAFSLEIPDGKYRVNVWVRSLSRTPVSIVAEDGNTPASADRHSGARGGWHYGWTRASLVTQVSDGSLDLAFTSDGGKFLVAALAVQGRSVVDEPTPVPPTTTVPPTTVPPTTVPPTTVPPTTVPPTTVPPTTVTPTTVPPTTVPPTTVPPTTVPPTTVPPTTVPPTTVPPTTAPPSKSCTNPAFTTSDENGGWSNGGYYVHNNMWNASEGGPETLYACAYNNWYVTSTQPNTTSVKTYPNVHKDYDNKPISSFRSLTSTFAATSPHVGIYNVAYDIWLNGVADSNSTELMIWTENYKQRPAGSVAATVTLGGQTYDVWKEPDSKYIAFVPKTVMTSGSVNLLEIFNWTISKGWMPASSTVGQIDYGVEICSTENKAATFRFTDFSISES